VLRSRVAVIQKVQFKIRKFSGSTIESFVFSLVANVFAMFFEMKVQSLDF